MSQHAECRGGRCDDCEHAGRQVGYEDGYEGGYLAGQLAMRERAALIATNPYSDAVQAYGGRRWGDEPLAVGRKIATAIRALAPEEPT